MKNDIIINKTQSILRCIARVREEYSAAGENFLTDFSKQDSTVLNLQRASQIAIDIAAHVVRVKALNVPKEIKDLFLILYQNKIISEKTKNEMVNMVGFRNIAVHEYQELDINIVISVIEKHLTDFNDFIQEILSTK